MIAPVRPAVRAGAVGLSGLAAKRLSPLSTVELDRYNGNHFSVVPELGLIAVGRGVRADEYRLSLLDFGGELVQEIKNHSAVFAAAPGPNGQWLIADEYSMALYDASGERLNSASYHYKNERGHDGRTNVLWAPGHDKWYVSSQGLLTRLNADASPDKEYSSGQGELHFSAADNALYVTQYNQPFNRRLALIRPDGALDYMPGGLDGSGSAILTESGRWGVEFDHMKHGLTVYDKARAELFALEVPNELFGSAYDAAARQWLVGSKGRVDVFDSRGQWLGFHAVEQNAYRRMGAQLGVLPNTKQAWVLGEAGLEVLEGPLSTDLRAKPVARSTAPQGLGPTSPRAPVVLAPDSVPATVRPSSGGFDLGSPAPVVESGGRAPDAHLQELKARVVPALDSFDDAQPLIDAQWRVAGPEALAASLAALGDGASATARDHLQRTLRRTPNVEQLGLSALPIAEARQRYPLIARGVEAVITRAELRMLEAVPRETLVADARAQTVELLSKHLLPELKSAEGDERARVFATGRSFIEQVVTAIETIEG